MEASDWFRRLDVYRIVVAERAPQHAEGESESLNMSQQVRKYKATLLAFAPI